jgi:zinc protease
VTTTKVDRSRLPEPSAARTFSFPIVVKSVLPNGLRVWTARHGAVPIVAYLLLVQSGSSSDPDGKEGLAAIATKAAATARLSACTRRSRASAPSSTPTSGPTPPSSR